MLPKIGFGTWKLNGITLKKALYEAIKAGYQLIDSAAYYENEKIIGEVLNEREIDHSNLFITSKLWNTERGYDQTCKAFNNSLKQLKLKYLDIYLIHWPANTVQFKNAIQINQDTWRALETLYQEEKIKMIGVSNFLPHHLESLFETAKIRPFINQIEIHPGFYPQKTINFCQKHQIIIEAWSPLGAGKILQHPLLVTLANKYQVTAAQVALRWLTQQSIIPLPRSANFLHIKNNLELNFSLTQQEIEKINHLPEYGFSGLKPDEVIF